MLLEMIINIFFGLATLLIDMIPDLEFDSGFLAAFESVSAVMDGASYVMPVGTFAACLSVFFVLQNASLIISIFNWIIRKIPGVN